MAQTMTGAFDFTDDDYDTTLYPGDTLSFGY